MKTVPLVRLGLVFTGLTIAASSFAVEEETAPKTSPIYGVSLPAEYRRWELIAPARESAPLNELRALLGNSTAVDAYKRGTRPFPDGAVLIKLAWKDTQSKDFPSASVPGAVTTVQVMVKDSHRFAATGGWGFGKFVNGEPTDKAQHQTCFACHQVRVKNRDFVFTRFAP